MVTKTSTAHLCNCCHEDSPSVEAEVWPGEFTKYCEPCGREMVGVIWDARGVKIALKDLSGVIIPTPDLPVWVPPPKPPKEPPKPRTVKPKGPQDTPKDPSTCVMKSPVAVAFSKLGDVQDMEAFLGL